MKKIWILNHYATETYFNEGGRHYWFAKELIRKGYDVTIFCASTRHSNQENIKIDGSYRVDTKENIKFVFVPTSTYNNGLSRVVNMVQFYLRLSKIAKKNSAIEGVPDRILASSVHPLTMVRGIFLSRKYNIPCVCEIRDLWPEAIFKFTKLKETSLLGKIFLFGERWIYRNADSIVFTKEGDIDYLRERNWTIDTGGDIDQKKVHYINNGVDLAAYAEQVKNGFYDADLESDKKKIIYTGSLRPVNDIAKIVEVAELLKERNDILFLVYGEGSEKERLTNLIKEKNLDNIILKGFTQKKYVPYILSKSTINLLHYSEDLYNWTRGNSSNKLFEYLASGKPVISTVKMGYSIIENNQCGLESETNNSKDIADAITFLLNNEELSKKYGDNAFETAKLFDFINLTNKLEKVLLKEQEVYVKNNFINKEI